jgi:hypothetical protein
LLPHDDLDILEAQASALIDGELSHFSGGSPEFDRAADALLTRHAVDYMAEHPLGTLRQKVLNGLYFFPPWLVPFDVATPETRVVIDPSLVHRGQLHRCPCAVRPCHSIPRADRVRSAVLFRCRVTALAAQELDGHVWRISQKLRSDRPSIQRRVGEQDDREQETEGRKAGRLHLEIPHSHARKRSENAAASQSLTRTRGSRNGSLHGPTAQWLAEHAEVNPASWTSATVARV